MKSRFLKTNAIVLNSIKFGEGHRIIRLYTETIGKVEATAFGVRKTKSRFGSKLEPFSIGNLLLYRKKEEGLFTIEDIDIQSYNLSIRENLEKFVIGNAIIESILRLVESSQVDRRLFHLLLNALSVLNEIIPEKGIYLLSIYDFQFLSIMGYNPDIYHCVFCESDLVKNGIYMDPNFGFPLCAGCRTKSSQKVLDATVRFIEWSRKNFIINSKKVTMKEETLRNVRSVVENIYMFTFQKRLESWKQLNLVGEKGFLI